MRGRNKKNSRLDDAQLHGLRLEKFLPWLMIIAGLIALVASVALSIEVFNRLKNPNFVPVCNLNPVLSCTSVADSSQSHIFGFPNYFMGIAGYAAVVTIGTALLAGAKFARWFWLLIEAGMVFAVAFVSWLQFQTLYRIGALCIFCMITWAATIPLFWYTSLYNIEVGNIISAKRFGPFVGFVRRHHADILIVWFLVITLLILKRFWYYWSTLI